VARSSKVQFIQIELTLSDDYVSVTFVRRVGVPIQIKPHTHLLHTEASSARLNRIVEQEGSMIYYAETRPHYMGIEVDFHEFHSRR